MMAKSKTVFLPNRIAPFVSQLSRSMVVGVVVSACHANLNGPHPNPTGAAIVNLHDRQVVETGFLRGTSTDENTPLYCQFDQTPPTPAIGIADWVCPLPSGAATWRLGSQHTIQVGPLAGDSVFAEIQLLVTKGNNKDTDGNGYPDAALGAPDDGTHIGFVAIELGAAGNGQGLARTTVTGPHVGATFGGAVAMGDVNGDGYGDVAVGANTDNTSAGAAYVYHGSAKGLGSGVVVSLTGNASSQFGTSLFLADYNGDGYDDLAVGAPQDRTGAGSVYLYAGGPLGIVTASQASLSPVGSNAFGAVVTIGDLNGDGYCDLAVGSDDGFTGEVYLFAANATGLATPSVLTLAQSSNFGSAIVIGDVNGDGYPDLVVGDPGYNGGTTGAALLYLGKAKQMPLVPSQFILGAGNGGHFGASLALGDSNGDGYADLLVGAPFYGNGAIFLYNGMRTGFSIPAASSVIDALWEDLGWGVAFRDLNGDGYSDAIAGAPFTSPPSGAAYLYLGSSAGPSPTATTTWMGASGNLLGKSLAM